ncbi:MAG: CPBP family intramembrane metalloprotease [Candidatus Thorarchaeota archaeon]|nr:CPBP family intramembrane metalloprotease [Candidatus Thorarchaeota archaeon]
MTVLETGREIEQRPAESKPFLSRIELLPLALILITIAVVWRQIDIFILGLGDTWMNILPNKLFTMLIILGIFWRYRRSEIEPILGLSRNNLRTQLAMGTIIGLVMIFFMDSLPVILYGTFIDTAYPLNLNIIAINMLWYQFLFFLCNAVVEESLFRGMLQNGLNTYTTPNRAILISAIIFGIYHVCWPILKLLTGGFNAGEAFSMLLFSGITGGFFGIYYEKFSSRKSLMGPIAAHTLINFINENFKIGPEIADQGPDLAFGNPAILGIAAVMFLVTMTFLIAFVWRYRIESVQVAWKKFVSVFTKE